MMRRAAAALLVMLALPAFANITTSSLTGTVVIGDTPAPGVTVTVTSPALQHPRATATNGRGRYWLDALPPGTYDVTFSLPAHTTLTRRAVLELARVARVDATLEPNPDEDSTTSTAMAVSVAETIFPTTHFDDRALDRLPTGRVDSAELAPANLFGNVLVDGIPVGAIPSEETIEQITTVNGVSPAEWEAFFGTATAFRTRSGGEEFFFTLRDTITEEDGLKHFGEATAGGRIVPQRLWFFAAGWSGEEAHSFLEGHDGLLAKIDAQLGASHHLDASYNDTTQNFDLVPFESDTASLRYTAVLGPRFTSQVVAGRTTIASGVPFDATTDFVSGRASYAAGDHVLTAGFTTSEGDGPEYRSFFASDRWSFSRWNVYAGLHYDDSRFDDSLLPRVGVSYDFHGNGARAIVATWGEYAPPGQALSALRVMSLGFASAIGNSGAARADVIRREQGDFWQHDLQLDARYRLFDRFEAGGTYTLTNRDEFGGAQPFYPDQIANAWLGAEMPVRSHEFGVTVLQRYAEYSNRTESPTDVALRYAIPLSRLGLLLAVDATNVFERGNLTFTPRAVRFWVRLRVK
jgi:hypothetical protein